MKAFLKNLGALFLGVVVGALVNSAIIWLQPYILPLPDGYDPNDLEQIKVAMKSFHWTHFMMPLFAHALGTLSGAYVAARLAVSRPLVKALGIAVVFLFGGIQMVQLLPSPMWFNVIDLGLAYIPMGYLGYLLAKRSEVHQTIPE